MSLVPDHIHYQPSDFGLDLDSIIEFRLVQMEGLDYAAYSDKRFAVLSMPVGSGKSLIGIALAKLMGVRTSIVVPYKGLQDQYAQQTSRHTVDIRGRSNYDCQDFANMDCRAGAMAGCRYAGSGGGAGTSSGCSYEQQVRKARNSGILVTNFDYWLTKNDRGGGFGRNKKEVQLWGDNPVELLVLDEGDMAAEKVAEYLAVRLYEGEIKEWGEGRKLGLGEDVREWKEFAQAHLIEVELRIEESKIRFRELGRKVRPAQIEELHKLEKLFDKLDRVAGMEVGGEWVLEKKESSRYGRSWAFDVVWPGRYTEQYLFRGIPKVVIMSGTINSKDMAQLGVKREDYDYRQWSSTFPANRQPVYLCPAKKLSKEGKWVSVRIDRGTSEADLRLWVEWMDKFIDGRLDRKGLIQTTSYEWSEYIMKHSRHKGLMVGNTADEDSDSAAEVAEKFYNMPAPRILVSPSFSRGWDFKYDRAEYTIICKCPFIPLHTKVNSARRLKDGSYGDNITMKKVEQGDGRIKRAEDDRGETMLMDGHFEYFLWKCKGLAQKWWVDKVRKLGVGVMPKAPPKLEPKI